ncbi:hypothetical protein V8G54_015489 [Vigna mungo]|uniref:Uncharacterized protein n=1 Tax=Vigna mungo TaxID=3915 RepID=A0AAQ3RWW3_VIGMU
MMVTPSIHFVFPAPDIAALFSPMACCPVSFLFETCITLSSTPFPKLVLLLSLRGYTLIGRAWCLGISIVIIEFLGKFTKTVKLNWKLWLISVIIAFISWPLAVVGKLIPVPKAQLSNGVRTFFEKFKKTESEAS